MACTVLGMSIGEIPNYVDRARLQSALHRMLDELYRGGQRHFITGFEPGVDLWCMKYLAGRKKDATMGDLYLEALYRRNDYDTELEEIDRIQIIEMINGIYLKVPDGLERRYQFMLEHSSIVIAVLPPDDCDSLARLSIVRRGHPQIVDLRVSGTLLDGPFEGFPGFS